ncbi:MAG: hypothetical protein ACYTFZ_05815 [Planctomycetota bacterium]|jgi:hypothetical protein
MNPSQLIAWLVCLVLAFGAAVLAINNSYKVAFLRRQFADVQRIADEQTELLGDIRGILERIERNMRSERAEAVPAGE